MVDVNKNSILALFMINNYCLFLLIADFVNETDNLKMKFPNLIRLY